MKGLPVVLGIVAICLSVVALSVSISSRSNLVEPKITEPIGQTPTLNQLPVKSPSGVLDVETLNGNKEAYVGKTVRVKGKIQIEAQYGERPCPADEPQCETLAGIELYLVGEQVKANMEHVVRIYKGGKRYPCSKRGQVFVCGSFVNNKEAVVRGTWVRDREPGQTVGNSAGTYKVLNWRDVYYLEVD